MTMSDAVLGMSSTISEVLSITWHINSAARGSIVTVTFRQ